MTTSRSANLPRRVAGALAALAWLGAASQAVAAAAADADANPPGAAASAATAASAASAGANGARARTAATPVTSEQFAPGWQDHARSLVNLGVVPTLSRTKWYVPAILPRGDYVLVTRTGDKAELIEGYRFTVGVGNVDQYLFLTPGYSDVQALPIDDVPALKASPGAAALR